MPLLLHGQGERSGFRPNKGQWHPQVEYRSELSNGKLYLEERGFTFDLHDPEKMAAFLEHHHGKGARQGPKSVPFHAYRARFQGTDGPGRIERRKKSRSYANFYLSDDTADWASKVHSYGELTYKDLYPGIDMRVEKKGNGGSFKYELLVAPEGDPDEIRLRYKGVKSLELNEKGELLVRTSVGTVKETPPLAYYASEGKQARVPCEYELEGKTLSFRFPEGYDSEKELLIDPTLIFSTYSGSGSNNFGYTATFDSEGYLYSGSTAFGNSYPTTAGAYQTNYAGGTGILNDPGTDIALSKYDTSGTFMVWSTYLGGSSDELPHSMIVNENDELFVYGTTSSPDFPVTPSAHDTSFNGGNSKVMNGLGVNFTNGSDIIVSRLSNDGTALLASTFIGGSANDGLNTNGSLRYNYADEVRGEIIIDENNRCYIASTTRSTDFPTTSGSYQPNFPGGDQSGCVMKLDNSLTTLLWSSYFGGSGQDAVYSLTLDQNDDLFISGGTTSPDIQTDSNVVQANNAGGRADAFVAHLTSQGDSLIGASYWGSPDYDQSYFVRLDNDDHVHLFGQTETMDSTFIIDANYATPNSGQYITQMTTEMDSVIWSTVFGSGSGNIDISPTAFLVDVCHKIYLSGWGGATNDVFGLNNNTGTTNGMDVTSNAYQDSTDGSDFYVMVLQDDANGIVYGTFMGGGQAAEHVDGGTSRFSKKGRIYQSVCAGCGGYSDFPIKPNPGAVSATNNNSCNNAVFKMDFDLPITVADMDHPGVVCSGDSVQFTDQSVGGHDLVWEFGDGDTSHANNPTHVYDSSGTFRITLTVDDSNTCNLMDSVKSTIQVLGDTTQGLADSSICLREEVSIGVQPLGDSGITYQWQPTNGLSDPNEPNPVASPSSTTSYELYISNGVCTDTLMQTVQVTAPIFSVSNDTIICQDADSLELFGSASPPDIDRWYWSKAGAPDDTLNDAPSDSTIKVLPDTSSVYILTGFKNGCSLRDSVNVQVSPLKADIPSDTTICLGDTLRLRTTTNGLGPVQYDWAPDASIIQGDSSQQIVAAPDMSTTYSVSVSDDHCSSSASVNVGVSDLSQQTVTATSDEDTILAGGSTTIHAEPDHTYDVSWIPSQWLEDPNAYHTEASPATTTTFELLMTDGGGCLQRDTVRIRVYDLECKPPDLFIPNAFTPNGDGENDVLYVRGKNIEKMTFRIFDRWGEKVFESHDPDKGWDGTYQGRALDPDVYVYYLEITCQGDKKYFEKGNITLIR